MFVPYVPIESCPGNPKRFADVLHGITLISIQGFGHRHLPGRRPPPFLPRVLAACSPACVRSRMISRSNVPAHPRRGVRVMAALERDGLVRPWAARIVATMLASLPSRARRSRKSHGGQNHPLACSVRISVFRGVATFTALVSGKASRRWVLRP
jgi:hypothetical protein